MARYKIQTGEVEITFRSISAEEADKYYHSLAANDNPFFEEMLFSRIIENKDLDIDSLPAGIVPTILYCAFKKSGYLKEEVDIPNSIDRARETLTKSIFFTLYSTIISTQPYTLDALRLKSINELFELFALSELILGKQVANTEEMRKSILEASQSHLKKETGVGGVTPEEIALVKNMINREEYNSEVIF